MAKKLPRVLKLEEQYDFLNQFNKNCPTGFRNYCMCQVMLSIGLRISEVIDLEVEDIDFKSGRVHIHEGKGSKDRILWLDRETLLVIREWIGWRNRLIAEGKMIDPLEIGENEDNYLFITFRGTQVWDTYLRPVIKKMAVKGGLKKPKEISPHTLRHTYATDFLTDEEGNLMELRDNLGHEDISTTQIYVSIADEKREKSMKNYGEKRMKRLKEVAKERGDKWNDYSEEEES